MLVVESGIQSNLESTRLKEVVAIVHAQVLVDVRVARRRLLQTHVAEHLVHVHHRWIVVAIDVAPGAAVRVAGEVAHVVGIVYVDEIHQVQVLLAVQCRVEHDEGARVPVAADVHGPCVSRTRLGIVDGGRGYAVFGVVVAQVHRPSALFVDVVAVVEGKEVVVPRRAQSGVTGGYVQRVAGVHHLEQVGHRGLRHAGIVAQAQLAGVRDFPSQVYAWGPVEGVPHDGGVELVLYVVHVRGLRLEVDAGVQSEFLSVLELRIVSCHHVGLVVIFLVGSVLRVLDVPQIVQCVQCGQVAQVELLGRVESGIFGLCQERVDAVHRAVAVGVSILELIGSLQVEVLRDGFGV